MEQPTSSNWCRSVAFLDVSNPLVFCLSTSSHHISAHAVSPTLSRKNSQISQPFRFLYTTTYSCSSSSSDRSLNKGTITVHGGGMLDGHGTEACSAASKPQRRALHWPLGSATGCLLSLLIRTPAITSRLILMSHKLLPKRYFL